MTAISLFASTAVLLAAIVIGARAQAKWMTKTFDPKPKTSGHHPGEPQCLKPPNVSDEPAQPATRTKLITQPDDKLK